MPATGSCYFTQPQYWHRKMPPIYVCAWDMEALWIILHYGKYRTVAGKRPMKWNLNVCTTFKHSTNGEVEGNREQCWSQWFCLEEYFSQQKKSWNYGRLELSTLCISVTCKSPATRLQIQTFLFTTWLQIIQFFKNISLKATREIWV